MVTRVMPQKGQSSPRTVTLQAIPASPLKTAVGRTISLEAGTVTILTLLASQRALLDAHRGYVLVWSDAATSLADLERAVGLPLEDIRLESAPEQARAEPVAEPLAEVARLVVVAPRVVRVDADAAGLRHGDG